MSLSFGNDANCLLIIGLSNNLTIDVTSKVGDHVYLTQRHHSFLFICVNIKLRKM